MSTNYIEPDKFNLLKGQEVLSIYHWGDKDVNHYFCRLCGVYPFHDTIYDSGQYRINLGCVDGLDPRKLKITQFDGKHEL